MTNFFRKLLARFIPSRASQPSDPAAPTVTSPTSAPPTPAPVALSHDHIEALRSVVGVSLTSGDPAKIQDLIHWGYLVRGANGRLSATPKGDAVEAAKGWPAKPDRRLDR
jgi:hypothetical protein